MNNTMIDRKAMAARLGISVDTFRRKVEKHPDFPLPVLRLSRETVRWEEHDFEQWLQRQRAMAKR